MMSDQVVASTSQAAFDGIDQWSFSRFHRMHLDRALGQIRTYSNRSTSCTLHHGNPPFKGSD
jgi:hypothetical protein